MTLKPLTIEQLYRPCDLTQFSFESTAELKPLDQPLGQERALEAIEFAVDIEQEGFNLFVLGATGLGKHQLVVQKLIQHAAIKQPQYDWCYVNNFENPQRPKLLKLPAGMGSKLRKDMKQLVEDLLTALPTTFQSDEYHSRRQDIENESKEHYDQAFRKLDSEAKERGITLVRTPSGYTLAPMIDDKIVTPEQFEQLPEERRNQIEKEIANIQLKLQTIVRDLPLMRREISQRIKALNKEFTQLTVEQFIAWIENQYHQHPEVTSYLHKVKTNAINNAQDFLPAEGNMDVEHIQQQVEAFHMYAVNLLVDNTNATGAPIIFEDNPTYQNLVGRVEYISQMGTLITDFTLIKAGALHKANGGYLVLEAQKVLSNLYAWEGLKRALKSREVKIESIQEMLSFESTLSLEPESIPIDVKVVLTGEPLLYYLLQQYDPEFSRLFKVAADFSSYAPRSGDSCQLFARMLATQQQRDGLRPLDRKAVGRIIELASRLAEDSEKLSLQIDGVNDLLKEADYWAQRAGSKTIQLEHIETSLDKQRYRRNRIQHLLQEQITRGINLIDTQGRKVAQINGLSVMQLGDYAFGNPSRITATARLGQGKVIDIEREVKLGGEIHSKGVLILTAYLANRYAHDRPLPLSASLVFEQSYGGVDGDSASAAELCVLLSAIADIPLKQSLAVTGSINQLGQIQPIGGVNEKIEGFFDICQQRGLDGEQGVIIPATNQVHLMLRRDVRQAVTAGQFNIYAVRQVDDVMALLSGLSIGSLGQNGRYSEGSFNRLIQDRIERLQQLHTHFSDQSQPSETANQSGSNND